MINKYRIIYIALIFLATNSKAKATTLNANASVTIQAALTILENTQLSFATIATSGASGTATMDNMGVVTVDGSGNSASGTATRGSLLISGDASSSITVSVGSSSLTGTGSAILFTPDVTVSSSCVALDISGECTLEVYGSLALGVSQISGSYTGNYTVTANY